MTIRRLSLFLLALASTTFAFQTSQVPDRISLERNWHIQSACKVSDSGDAISRAEYKVQGWLATSVPHTVLGAQVDAKLFPDPFLP